MFVAESLKRIKTKIWRIQMRIFWRFRCREQVIRSDKIWGYNLPPEPPVSDAPAWETIATTRQSTKTPHWYLLCWPSLSKMQHVCTYFCCKNTPCCKLLNQRNIYYSWFLWQDFCQKTWSMISVMYHVQQFFLFNRKICFCYLMWYLILIGKV